MLSSCTGLLQSLRHQSLSIAAFQGIFRRISTTSSAAIGSSGVQLQDAQAPKQGQEYLQESLLQQAAKELGQVRKARFQSAYIDRDWQWYDARDEREQQRKETQAVFKDAGYAHMRNVPQSMKKMNRIIKLVRGLSYREALAQCSLLPHKAARYMEQILQHAARDLEEKKKAINRSVDEQALQGRLIVDVVYATKGQYLKQPGYKGRGHPTPLITRRCHVAAFLREAPQGAYMPRGATQVPPLLLARQKLRQLQQS